MVILGSGQDTATSATVHAETPDERLSFPFLRLPMELREYIYRMLLTTQYAFVEHQLSDEPAYPGRFDLRPSILLANKQMYIEAGRVRGGVPKWVEVSYNLNDYLSVHDYFVTASR